MEQYRQEVILNEMRKQGYITQEEYDEAVAQELVFVKNQGQENTDNIYTWYEETVISDVREALAKEYGWSAQQTNMALQRGGLRIYTCYDPTAQALAERWTDRLAEEMTTGGKSGYRHVKANYRQILDDFAHIPMEKSDKVKVGIVGEIFVKYSPLGNNNLEDFLLSEGAEPVVPGLTDFMISRYSTVRWM